MPIDCDQFITKHINLLLLLFLRLILVHHILFHILGRCEAIAKKMLLDLKDRKCWMSWRKCFYSVYIIVYRA